MKTTHIYGLHAVKACLQQNPQDILALYVLEQRRDKRLQSVIDLAQRQGIKAQSAAQPVLDEKSKHAKHQGVVAQIKAQAKPGNLIQFVERLEEPVFLLVLDGVQDPHNLGACLRTANAAGVHAVVIPQDKAVGVNDTVRKVACGAAEFTPVFTVTNLARTLRELKELGIWLYGASGEAQESLHQTNLNGPIAIILGAEGQGLRHLTEQTCDALVSIPMYGQVESLNVSVAAGVVLFEAVRQRR